MKNQAIVLIIIIFFLSIVCTLSIDFPANATSYDKGFAVGTIFGHAIKLIGVIGLVLLVIKRYGKQRLTQ